MAKNNYVICTSHPPICPKELAERRLALRDGIICLGWLKICSSFCYLGLYFLVKIYSDGFWQSVISTMIAVLIPLEIINGILLFLGVLETQPAVLKIAALLCLVVAVFNTVLGVMGALFFFRIGDRPIHFMISLIFGFIALCFCSVLFHDIIVIFAYLKLVQSSPPLPPNPPGTLAITYNP